MYRGRGFSPLEKSGIVFSFLAAALAGYGAFLLLERLPHWARSLSGLAALYCFFVVLVLMLKGVDAYRDERIQRLIKEWESRLDRQKKSN